MASIDCYGCNSEYIKDKVKIKEFIAELCDHIKMVRYGEPLIERFAEGPLEGCSAMQFIETSSVTMHFDELEDRAFIDVFSCAFFDPEEARKFCEKFLEAKSSKELHFFRV